MDQIGQNEVLTNMNKTKSADSELDISDETCPMTYVRTRLALDRMSSGQTLLVRLRGAEPLRNVPATATQQGHHVVSIDTDPAGLTTLLLRKG